MFNPRPHQRQILAYQGGWMAVSAVPGSGKTHTLSALGAKIIADNNLRDDQEILIVTLTNSAVDNFIRRIDLFVKGSGLPENFGYRVRTLHGLAHDIIRERPDLAGLPNQFNIIDEQDTSAIIQNIIIAWQGTHPDFIKANTNSAIDPQKERMLHKEWAKLLQSIAIAFIRTAKDFHFTPDELALKFKDQKANDPLLEMGIGVFTAYQRALAYRSALDFDDLVRLSIRVLKQDQDYLQRLRYRWPYILEDEAQDSSRLQEEVLRLLAGDDGNWVRVGDPNQAIYETFTTASPKYLKEFMQMPGVQSIPLPQSGRSSLSIIQLANELIRWTSEDHPNPFLRDGLTPPYIDPTDFGDSQSNPPDQPEKIFLSNKTFQPAQEIDQITASVKKWLALNPEKTAAILVSTNSRGAKIAESLRQAGVEPLELLQNTNEVRQSAKMLAAILDFLSDPGSARKLSDVMESVFRGNNENKESLDAAQKLIKTCPKLEEYLWPTPDHDWLYKIFGNGRGNEISNLLTEFRDLIRTWQKSTILPIDQLILTISPDLFSSVQELALAHQIAVTLEFASQSHPEWRLPDFSYELKRIVSNSRAFFGASGSSDDFDPDLHKGKVVVSTIHKAKGLEWDRVYLLSANNYDFPSAEEIDQFISEKWFVRDGLNLQAEMLARLNALASGDNTATNLEEGVATEEARLDYARERLRLLFVGLTRAKSELVITWNTGMNNNCKPALAFDHLYRFWQENNDAPST